MKRQVVYASAGRGWSALEADLIRIPVGRARVPGGELHVVGMHVGRPVRADCSVGGTRMRRLQKSGDIDFIPAGVEGWWEDDGECELLRLSLRPSFLAQVADELEAKVRVTPCLQLRDARIEALGWAIKAELEAEEPSDALYVDHLASALAVRLIALGGVRKSSSQKLSTRQLSMLTEYIETNLSQRLQLAELAQVAGMSVTRLKALFRNSLGMSVHQYVMRRRVAYARVLLATTGMPAVQVALAAGFAHQSHMATTMGRILGQTPRELPRSRS